MSTSVMAGTYLNDRDDAGEKPLMVKGDGHRGGAARDDPLALLGVVANCEGERAVRD